MKKLGIIGLLLAVLTCGTAFAGNDEDVSLPAGQQLTVTADAVSTGTVARLADVAGGPSQGFASVSASSSVVYGPFSVPTFWRVTTTGGALTYAVAYPTAGTFAAAAITSASAGSLAVSGASTFTGRVISVPQDLTVADSGNGSAATATLTPTSGVVACTCSDTDGCAITLSETGAVAGSSFLLFSAGANACTIADSAGVQETSEAISLATNDNVRFTYSGSAWFQSGKLVNN